MVNTNPEKIIKNILGTQTTRKARPVRRQPVRRMRQSTNGQVLGFINATDTQGTWIDNTECENMSNKECLADHFKEYTVAYRNQLEEAHYKGKILYYLRDDIDRVGMNKFLAFGNNEKEAEDLAVKLYIRKNIDQIITYDSNVIHSINFEIDQIWNMDKSKRKQYYEYAKKYYEARRKNLINVLK